MEKDKGEIIYVQDKHLQRQEYEKLKRKTKADIFQFIQLKSERSGSNNQIVCRFR